MDALLLWLMPISAAASCTAVLLRGVETAVFAAAFNLLWSVKNWVRGPLKGDAGIVTFPAYIAAVSLGWSQRARAGCALLLALNFWVPCLMTLGAKSSTIAKKMRKSERWARFFRAYLGVSALYWTYVGVLHLRSGGK